MRYIWIAALSALNACGPTTDITPPAETKPLSTATMNAESGDDLAIASYNRYCFVRVGQVGAEPKRGEACEVYGGGAGARMEGLARPERNSATLHISSPSLEAIGVDTASFNLNRGGAAPKFITGVHAMDQVRVTDEEKEPKDLPDRMTFVGDVTGTESMFSWTSPDAAHLRERAPSYDFSGYEIASAVLTIDSSIDLEVDVTEMAGMTLGEQYIEGTLSISLIPMGSKGEQFGPTTFEFGTTIGWGYVK